MSNKFNDILQEINNVKVTIDSYSPSIKQPVQLSPLTLAQQKSIIESSADSNLSASKKEYSFKYINTIFGSKSNASLIVTANSYKNLRRLLRTTCQSM